MRALAASRRKEKSLFGLQGRKTSTKQWMAGPKKTAEKHQPLHTYTKCYTLSKATPFFCPARPQPFLGISLKLCISSQICIICFTREKCKLLITLTGVVNMELINDSLVSAAENHHQFSNWNCPMAVPLWGRETSESLRNKHFLWNLPWSRLWTSRVVNSFPFKHFVKYFVRGREFAAAHLNLLISFEISLSL